MMVLMRGHKLCFGVEIKKGLMEWEQKVMVNVSQLPSGRGGSSGKRQCISWAHMSKVEATPLLVHPYPSLV